MNLRKDHSQSFDLFDRLFISFLVGRTFPARKYWVGVPVTVCCVITHRRAVLGRGNTAGNVNATMPDFMRFAFSLNNVGPAPSVLPHQINFGLPWQRITRLVGR